MTRRQLTAVFLVNAIGYLCVATILLDRGYRRRLAARTGVSAYGYRGVARVGKAAGERRLVVVGGSFAFGSGLRYADTIPALMSGPLGRQPQPIHVANLAEPGAGARTYVRALNDYAYLAPDVILIIDGYDAPSGLPPGGGRRASAVFRHIGYLPALPALRARPPALSTDVDPLSTTRDSTILADARDFSPSAATRWWPRSSGLSCARFRSSWSRRLPLPGVRPPGSMRCSRRSSTGLVRTSVFATSICAYRARWRIDRRTLAGSRAKRPRCAPDNWWRKC